MTFAEAITELRVALHELGDQLWARRVEVAVVAGIEMLVVLALTMFGWIG